MQGQKSVATKAEVLNKMMMQGICFNVTTQKMPTQGSVVYETRRKYKLLYFTAYQSNLMIIQEGSI